MRMYRAFYICLFVISSCAVPRFPEYQGYRHFVVKSLGFSKSAVSLDLDYYNPNNFGMQLKRTDLDIYINGALLGHSSSDTLIRIPRRGSFSVPVTFDIDMRNAFKNAFTVVTKKEIPIRIEGKMTAGKGNTFVLFPVSYETKEIFSLY